MFLLNSARPTVSVNHTIHESVITKIPVEQDQTHSAELVINGKKVQLHPAPQSSECHQEGLLYLKFLCAWLNWWFLAWDFFFFFFLFMWCFNKPLAAWKLLVRVHISDCFQKCYLKSLPPVCKHVQPSVRCFGLLTHDLVLWVAIGYQQFSNNTSCWFIKLLLKKNLYQLAYIGSFEHLFTVVITLASWVRLKWVENNEYMRTAASLLKTWWINWF